MTVYVSAIMWYKVKDATSAIANVDDYSGSAKLLAATTLRNVLGTRNLAEILSERESISKVMQDALDEATDLWGVKVSSPGVQSPSSLGSGERQDFLLPRDKTLLKPSWATPGNSLAPKL